jgi:hypothetical protein
LNAVFLLATLKRRGQLSHTATLREPLGETLKKKHDVRSEIVHLVGHAIKPGARGNMGKGDGWPAANQPTTLRCGKTVPTLPA